MNEIGSVQQLILSQVEKLAQNSGYDFLFEENYGELLAQIIERDDSGSITETPFSFKLFVNEEKGTGKIIPYNPKGELRHQEFNIDKPQTIIALLTFIQMHL
ncbi:MULTISPECIES: hypothetical protein [Bacillaceae]|uniref:Uncharacterized protein n=1 Tax=Peribacillus huizhouensis TaxID=1501239 RepID=A0ABR6CTH9_9BACI|nr:MULTISPECIES: hypothetical protein [Bacillaceae]MBA9028226.1 hypothetical protein [Peribacillus huizhouensis]